MHLRTLLQRKKAFADHDSAGKMDLRTLIQRFFWIYGSQYSRDFDFKKRPPHRISADLGILKSAHTGFADVDNLTSEHHTPQNDVSSFASEACTRLGLRL